MTVSSSRLKLLRSKLLFVPVFKTEDEKKLLTEGAEHIRTLLSGVMDALTVKVDAREEMRPADKYFYWIQRGVPLRLEYGSKDHASGTVMAVRRDTREKISIPVSEVADRVPQILADIQKTLFDKALALRKANTFPVRSYDEMAEIIERGGGFIEAMWDGSKDTANLVKEKLKATIRVILAEDSTGKCAVSGKPSKYRVIYAQSY
ncbi:hypothetical protein CHS0354_002047 [Potamilus streckersoni]|uniref:proline--tRNA ligase n=1 Tax=Potamilus streckersoni TaxID=2493646 RepID=A0AAE0T5P8_9BIVA|nr:hypothetical protein CHS0354_002047 [Potamilus streckersoni]